MEFCEQWLDDHKLAAFKTTFVEPALLYFSAISAERHLINTIVHGRNLYAAVLMSTLGVQLPVAPFLDDNHRWGWVPFLRVAKADPDFKSALDVLWKPENLGKDRVTLPPCKNVKSVPSEVRPPDKTFIWDDQEMTPRTLANAALDMSASNKDRRDELSEYLAKFIEWFSGRLVGLVGWFACAFFRSFARSFCFSFR